MRNTFLVMSMMLVSAYSYAQWGIWDRISTFHYIPDKILNFDGTIAVAARYTDYAIQKNSYDVLITEDQGTSWQVACSFHSTLDTTVVVTNLTAKDSLLYMLVKYTYGSSWLYRMFSLDHSGVVSGGLCTGLGQVVTPGILLAKDSLLFLGCEHAGRFIEVYKSTDSGLTWTVSSNGIDGDYGTVTDMYVNGNRLFLTIDPSWNSNGIYYSDDNGESWIAQLPNTSVRSIDGNEEKIFISGTYLSYSIDNGISWLPTSNTGVTYHLAVEDDEVFAGRIYQGIYRSHDNGNTWEYTSHGFYYETELPRSLYIDSDTSNFYYITRHYWDHVFQPYYDMVVMKMPFEKDTASILMNGISQSSTLNILIEDSTMLAATEGNGIYYSSDTGNTWHTIANQLSGKNARSFIEFDTLIFTATDKGLYYSSDLGVSWTSDTAFTGKDIQTMAVHDSTLYVAEDTTVFYREGLNNWVEINNGLQASAISYLYSAGDTLYACTEAGLFMLYEPNVEWIEIGEIFEAETMVKIGKYLFVTGWWYLYKSSDYGMSWTTEYLFDNVNYLTSYDTLVYAAGYTGIFLYDWASGEWVNFFYNLMTLNHIIFSDSLIYVAGRGGIYSTQLSNVHVKVRDLDTKENLDVFPVPFKSFINIAFPDNINETVHLTIFNSNGQPVFESNYNIGQAQLFIEGLEGLAPGVYFVRLVTNDKIYTKKVVKY